MIRKLTIVFFGLLAGGCIWAQESVVISGMVEDPTGTTIAGQNLTLVHRQSGARFATASDENGAFQFVGLRPGDYTLICAGAGFRTSQLTIALGPAGFRNLRVKMELETHAEQVRVSARDSEPEAADNNASAVYLNSEMAGALPVAGENLLSLLSAFLSSSSQSQGGPSVVIDGAEGGELNLSADALKRIYINKNPYAAEYRHPGSSRIEVVTRNGSRGHVDGTLGLYARNSALDARNPFATRKPSVDRRLLEATLAGPLPFPHTRFFFSGTRLIERGSANVHAQTPAGPLFENVPTREYSTNLLGRVDSRTAKVHTFAFLYMFRDEPESGRGVGGLRLRPQATTSDERRQRFQFTDTAILSSQWLNTFRVTLERRYDRVGIPALQPAIQVSGAFVDGPSQLAESSRETRVEVQNAVSYSRGIHSVRFGGAFRPKKIDFTHATNAAGTFVFSDLGGFAAGAPVLYTITRGTPDASVSLHEAYGFLQDEMRVSSALNVTLGLRYDWQSRVQDANNFAPRIAIAYAPGRAQTVIRAGAGIFYDRVPESVFERAFLFDGARLREFVITQPAYPNAFVSSNTPAPPSVWRISPKLASPYLFQSNVAVEQKLGSRLQAGLEFQTFRGVHLLRARNLNAPPLTGGLAPNPAFFQIRQVESAGRLRGNALMISMQGWLLRSLKMKAQYTFSRTSDDTSGAFELPANNFDLRPEYGRSAFDRNHRFTMAFAWSLPWQIRLGSLLQFSSGAPFDITTGADNNGDGTVNDRPFGVVRNAGRGPAFAQVDLRVTKLVRLWRANSSKDNEERGFQYLEISFDMFNLFNHPNFTNIVGSLSSPIYGRPASALTARTVQISIKYRFRADRD